MMVDVVDDSKLVAGLEHGFIHSVGNNHHPN